MNFLNSIEIGAQNQRTLPAAAYCSPEIFEQERQLIFSKRWVCAGLSCELPTTGSYIVRRVGGESLLLVRDESGQPRAHVNHCRHRGTELCAQTAGQLRKTIQCPYHAWTYALDGRLVGVPDEDQMAEFCRDDYGLHAVACQEWEGMLWVNLDRAAEDFFEYIVAIRNKFNPWNLPRLVRLGQQSYDVAANWKLIVQNYSECYHCAVIHPGLVRLSPPRSGGNDLVEGPFLGGYMDVTAVGGSLTCSGRSCGPTVGSLDPLDRQRVYYYVLFPNVLLSLHHDYVMIHILWPVSPARTMIDCYWLFHPSTPDRADANPGDAVAFWDQTNREDWDICERTQRGVASPRYEPGPYSDREAMAAAFDRYYQKMMDN